MPAFPYRPSHLVVALFALATTAIVTAPAATAQTSTEVLTADQTRLCVCMSDEIKRRRGSTDSVLALQDEFNKLTAELDQLRQTINVYDQAQVNNFRKIHDQREQVRHQLQAPGVTGLLIRYNKQCANRQMFQMNIDAARANPQCPQF